MEDEEEEVAGDDTKIVDITLGDLVDAIKAAMGGQSEMSDMETSEDDTISLDEILAELDEEGAGDYMEEAAGVITWKKRKKSNDDHSISDSQYKLKKNLKTLKKLLKK
jgi:hypothetical protein